MKNEEWGRGRFGLRLLLFARAALAKKAIRQCDEDSDGSLLPHYEPIRPLRVLPGIVHPDARGDLDGTVRDEQPAILDPQPVTAERQPVVFDRNPQQFRYFARPDADVAGDFPFARAVKHQLLAVGGHDAPDEHRIGNVRSVGHEVEQMVHAVAKIDVGDPALTVHHFVAFRAPAPEGVRRAVVRALVGFRLANHAARELPVHRREQGFPDEVARNRHHIVREKIVFRQFHCRRISAAKVHKNPCLRLNCIYAVTSSILCKWQDCGDEVLPYLHCVRQQFLI